MERERRLAEPPFFSICIPQYNRTSFLIAACRSLAAQTFRSFEVCISDDCSTDRREGELLAFLEAVGLAFCYRRQQRNLRYDGNLRAAIGLARGRFCLLLGNDDALATPSTLADLHDELRLHPSAAVAITNYEEFAGAAAYTRVPATGIAGSGPAVAVRSFRNFSFVSGVILDRAQAQAHTSARWDGSEMYQMYLGCRIIAVGGALLNISQVAIRKDIRIAGEHVESYAASLDRSDRRIIERALPLRLLGRVVADAALSAAAPLERRRLVAQIFFQILLFTYPYWIIEYRRVHSWQYALGVCLGMRPHYLVEGVRLAWPERLLITGVYALVTATGLLMPFGLFNLLHARLYALAKAL